MDRDLLERKNEAAGKAADKQPIEKRRQDQAKIAEEQRTAATLAHFEVVASTVRTICRNHPAHTPVLSPKIFSTAERKALTQMIMAKRGEDTKAIPLSASVRMKMLNQSLAVLYPTLALGNTSDLDHSFRMFVDVQKRIGDVRKKITSDAGVQAIVFKVAGPVKGKEDDEDGEDSDGEDSDGDGGGDDDGEDGEDGDGEDEDESATKKTATKKQPKKTTTKKQPKKKQGRIGRLFRNKPKSEQD